LVVQHVTSSLLWELADDASKLTLDVGLLRSSIALASIPLSLSLASQWQQLVEQAESGQEEAELEPILMSTPIAE